MTSWLIGLSHSDSPFSPVRAKVECCKSSDLFSCQVKDCSATRIISSSIMACHPWPTVSFVGEVSPLCRGAVGVFYNPSWQCRPYQVLPLQARVDLGAMAMKEYSALPKAVVWFQVFLYNNNNHMLSSNYFY